MPARDGTGPLGKGRRTGRGMGNCNSTRVNVNPPATTGACQPIGWGGRLWDATVARMFRRGRGNRTNSKVKL